jgi:Na+-transporting methylmalonyl-CoA/oxaloacetate decarboxylase gamma subunit
MTLSSQNVIASLALRPSYLEAAEFMFSGFIVVMTVLIAMYLFMKLLGVVFAGSSAKAVAAKAAAEAAKKAAKAPAAAPLAVAAAAAPSGSCCPHLVAVIAAAAHTVLGSRVRIVSVQPASGEWGAEGRRQIFASKNVRG